MKRFTLYFLAEQGYTYTHSYPHPPHTPTVTPHHPTHTPNSNTPTPTQVQHCYCTKKNVNIRSSLRMLNTS